MKFSSSCPVSRPIFVLLLLNCYVDNIHDVFNMKLHVFIITVDIHGECYHGNLIALPVCPHIG